MHGVLRHYTLSPKDVDEVVRRIAEGGVPIIKAIPGFVAFTMLDAGGGKLVTYSIYESQAGTAESTKRAASWVKEHVAPMLPTPPQVLEGDVRVREVKGRPTYGVIRRYQVDSKNMGEIITRAKSGFLPLVNALPGFATYQILDAGNGILVTLSGFTTKSAAEESTKKAAGWVTEHLSQLVPKPPEVTSGDLRIMVRATD
jgi:hypothetical protein